jgi:hypothetical protein
LISAPVLAGFKIGVGLSIVLGRLEGSCLVVWKDCSASPTRRIGTPSVTVGDHLDPECKRRDPDHVDTVLHS